MKNLASSFTKAFAIAACALTLGSCSRSEYAMLPKGASYHGVTRPANTVSTSVAPAAVATAPVAAPKAEVAAPVAAPKAEVAAVATPAPAKTDATVATTVAPKKLNLVQRAALKALVKKANKAAKAGDHANTASTQALDSNLRTAILLAAVGVLVEILGIVLGSSLVYLLGAVLIVVGAVFFIIWLVNKVS